MSQRITAQSIFLSYAHRSEREEDFDISEDLVWLIKAELERDGHSVWIDHKGIRGGTQWRERITDAITSHKHFLAFLSKRSVRQEPNVCLNEVAIAIKHNRIIQTILTESENRISAPLTLSSIQWHKFQDWKEIKEGKKSGPKGEDWEAWFGSLMTEIRQNLADITHQQKLGELGELAQILNPSSFTADIIQSVEGFFGRKWLFDAYKHWLPTDSRLFWLKGSPGIGKSSFAAKLVHNGNSEVVGFFKCSFQGLKSAEESASECIRTLAYQLASRLPDYRIKLLRGQMLDRETVRRKTSDDLFTYLITEPLNTSEKIEESQRIVLVIDALDEAGRKVNGAESNPLADLIYKHAEKLPSWLGIVVTSRPEAYLHQQLGPKFAPTVIEGGTEQNTEDISDYLETKLSKEIKGEERERIIKSVIEKSGGTFLYIKRVELSYDLSKPESLPIGMDDLFFKDFKRYFPDPHQYGDKTERFLRLMVAAPGPLSKELGQELLGWSARDVTLNVTQPMASILLETGAGLQLYHKSLNEWLLDAGKSGAYQVNSTGAKELGDFLWEEFGKYRDDYVVNNSRQQSSFENEIRKSIWHDQVVGWLTGLLPKTVHWLDRKALIPYGDFLSAHLIIDDECLIIYKRQFELIESECSIEDSEFIQSLQRYADQLIFYVEVYSRRYEEAIAICRKLLEIQEKIYGCEHPDRLQTCKSLIGLLCTQDQYEEAESLINSLLIIQEKVLGLETPESASFISDLADTLRFNGREEQAKPLFIRALKISEALWGVDNTKIIPYLDKLAHAEMGLGLLDEALPLFRRVIEISEKGSTLNHVSTTSSMPYRNLGLLLRDLGQDDEAEQLLRKALAIDEKEYGLEAFDVGHSLHYLGTYLIHLKRLDEAEAFIRRALSVFEKNLGSGHIDVAMILRDLGRLLSGLNRYEEAEPLYRRALEIKEKTLAAQSPEIISTLDALGFVLIDLKKYEDAEEFVRKSLLLKEKKYGIEHLSTAWSLNVLAFLLIDLQRNLEAEPLLRKILEIRTNLLGSEHQKTVVSMENLANLLTDLGGPDDADSFLRRALEIKEKNQAA